MKPKTYITMTVVEHDGTRYEIGQDIVLPDEAAKPLLDCGAVVEPAKGGKAAVGEGDQA